jgi:hypothetical protein
MDKDTIIKKLLDASAEQRKAVAAVLSGAAIVDISKAQDQDADAYRLAKITDAAKLLAVGRSTVYKLIKTGRLETRDLNGCQRVTMRSIKEFIDGERPANEQTKALIAESKARYAQSQCK